MAVIKRLRFRQAEGEQTIIAGTTLAQAFLRRRALVYFGVYALLTAIVLYPIATVTVPGLEDYPNHLARMYILSHYDQSPAFQRFYEVHWRPIPYLAMDAAFIVLSRIAPIYDAGRLFVGLCVVLPVASVAALHFAVHRRASLVPAAAFLLSYNALLLWGFLNYLPVLCLAVILFAGWIATTNWPRWRRLIIFSALTLLLYLGHLVAFGAYCLLVLCFEVFRALKLGIQSWRAILVDWSFAALQAAPAIILALSAKVERPFIGPVETDYGTIAEKILAILSPIFFLLTRTEAIFGLFALVIVMFGRLTGRLRLAPELFSIFLVVAVMSLCVPLRLLGVFGMDFRLPLLAAILLLSAISPTERASEVFKASILCFIILVTAVRSTLIAGGLREVDRQIAELRGVLSAMPKGMRLLTVDASQAGHERLPPSKRVTFHAPLVAVIDRDAFSPTLFTDIMTVKPKPEFKLSSTPNGYPYPVLADLIDSYGASDPTGDLPSGKGGRVYWMGWERHFDYVLVMHYGSTPTGLPKVLRLVSSSPVADLYEIDRGLGTRLH